MTTVAKPFWWASFANYYGFANDGSGTIDSETVISRTNLHLAPEPSRYSAHLAGLYGSPFPESSRIDILVLTGGHDFVKALAGADYISGGSGDDVLYGEAGPDILRGGAGADLLIGSNEGDGSAGNDTASYLEASAAITASLASGVSYVAGDGHGRYDMLYSIENIIGSDFNDHIDGQDSVNNTLIGGRGSDQISGGSGSDILMGGHGSDTLHGDTGNDVLLTGTGNDQIYTGSGQDRIVLDAAVLDNISANRAFVHDFQAGTGGDRLDVSALLHAAGYHGSNAVGDGYLRFSLVNGTDLKVDFDRDGSGGASAQHVITLGGVTPGEFSTGSNLIANAKTILYAPILGQSNAKGLSTAGADGKSGVTELNSGLAAMTDYDEVVSVLRDPGTGQAMDIAVGGTTVDGNVNTNYGPDRVWWYPDQNRPGEILLRAVDMLALQLAELRASGVVKPVIVWGQGEAETRRMGMASNATAAIERYKDATLAVFDYIKDRLGDDIEFYIMQTGRFIAEAARNDGLSESGISQTLKGVGMVQEAQEEMALERDDVHLAVNYSDLDTLYEADPDAYPTDVWHPEYEEREIIGARLADFIAADMGYNHVLNNPGPYPARLLADIKIHEGSAGGSSGSLPVINGTSGDDRLVGGAGGAEIHGLAGADRLISGGGETWFYGGFGKDSITCGSGRDTIVFEANILPDWSTHTDFIRNFQAGSGGDRLDISALLAEVGYSGSNPVADGWLKLVADGTRTKVLFDANGPGGSGPRYLATLDGVNVSDFSAAHNLVIRPESPPTSSTPLASGKTINGTSSPDIIIGTLGGDTIHGGSGKDTIMAGAGRDVLYGEGSSDTFVFDATLWSEILGAPSGSATNPPAFSDIIEDFTTGTGGDRIDIAMLLDKAGYGGSNPEGDGYIGVRNSGTGDAWITFDRDGGGAAQAVIIATLKDVSAAAFNWDANLVASHASLTV